MRASQPEDRAYAGLLGAALTSRCGAACLGGVDNQLPEVVATTMGFGVDGRAGLTQSIRQGQTAMVLRITDVNGAPGPTLNDPSVRVFVYRYAHPTFADCAMIGTPGLAYAIDNASLTVPGDLNSARLQFAGRIVNGRVVVERAADPSSARLDLPLAVTSSTPAQVPLRGVQLRFDLTADRGLRGNLGGTASLSARITVLTPMFPAGIPISTVATVLQPLVDVQDPAGTASGCMAPNGALGMGVGFEATRAVLAVGTAGSAAPGTCGGPATATPTCFTQDSAAPLCPSAAVPNPALGFRVTHMAIRSPAELVMPVIGNVLNDQLRAGRGLWGLSVVAPGTALRLGAFNPARWNPQSLSFTIESTGVATSGEAPGTVRLPVYQPDGSLLVEFPFSRARPTSRCA